MYTYLPAFGWC